MDSPIYENLRSLVNLVDELRDVGLQQYINLPRVCVVGTQSSGKSSVLEAIVGKDFLPRGEGIVTRRPLELRLIHTPSEKQSFAVFDTDKGKKWTNFDDVKAEIDRLTDAVAGKNKGIVDDPIVLSIFGAQCPDLTLIDLPGITRVPLRGSDQTDDIEKLTRDMASRYVEDPRTIILAVIAANADMSTSDALQIARRVDPKGLRTIGVITKIDLMDVGTDAVRMLKGEEVPLRLGYTGIINRSQADIRSGKTVAEALESEKLFFDESSTYKVLPRSSLGSYSLVSKLTKVLFRHIKHLLPDIRSEIDAKRRAVTARMEDLGEMLPSTQAGRAHILWVMINDYCEIIRSVIRGRYVHKLQNFFEQNELTNGSEIRLLFSDVFSEHYNKTCTSDMTDGDIDTAIQIHEGDSLPGFPSPDTFEYLIRPHMKKLHGPAMDCLDDASRLLEGLCQTIASKIFYRFPLLSEKVLSISQELLLREKENTKGILVSVVSAETSYLFTNDSQYLDNHGSMIKTATETEQDTPQSTNAETKTKDRSKALESLTTKSSQLLQSAMDLYHREPKLRYSPSFISGIRHRLDNYFALVVRSLRDVVPKCIGHFLIHRLLDCLQYELYSVLSDGMGMESLLGEPSSVVEEREALQHKAQVLLNAHQLLMRDPALTSGNFDIDESEFDHEVRRSQTLKQNHLQNNIHSTLANDSEAKLDNTYLVNGMSAKKASAKVSALPSNNHKSAASVLFGGRSQNAVASKLFDGKEQKRMVANNNPLFLED